MKNELFKSDRMYNTDEVADTLGISADTIRKLAVNRKIPCCIIDPDSKKKFRVFNGDDLNSYFRVR